MDLDGSNNNTNVQNEQAHDDDDEHLKNSHQPQLNNLTIEESESQTDIAMINDGEGGDDANSPESVQNKSSKPKFFTKRGKFSDRMSSAAKVALEKKIKPEPIKIKSQERNKPAITATTAPEAMDKNSASFLPTSIASASSSSSSSLASNASKAKFESVIQETKMDDKPRSFIDMYWIDANEVNGVVYLYGKTPKTVGSNDFCSICVVIKGNQHNLFVLPKSGADMMAVHNELKGVLPIPQSKGASWGSKVVKRKYAFGDEAIPREESQYLKVVYDAHHPKPSEEVCSAGGTHFSKILNAGATTLETFILKRKLMGPCWVRIYDAVQTSFPVSWCKIECTIDSPKKLVRCDKAKDDKAMEEINKKLPIRPAPPLTTVTIKIKTVVNPKSNKSEVISVSAICHQNINVDSSTIESRENMSQISLIRPLGQNISIESGGLPQLPRDLDDEIKRYLPGLKKSCNERALLNLLMTQIGNWDPDVLVGHNAWGYDMEVLLTRCIENKVQGWTKIGRRRNVNVPKGNFSGKEWAIADALKGRLLCDTYISAKELLRETTYSLTNLAQSQLKTERVDIEPVDIPQWFNKSSDVVKLALHTLRDAELVQRLMLKLQVLPLTKQLTSIAGNLWCRTMKGHRAERNEYLLLHEFHQLKYIVPEKRKNNTASSGRGKAKYSGGLVLEPKKGLYDTFILLLDFNSLYPSIVQEYNLCFTTMNWSEFVLGGAQNSGNVNVDDGESNPTSGIAEILPPVPADSQDTGVLPRVIKTLVERRRTVKTLMKNENNSDKKEEVRYL
jgi:DNA polymerase alpha subunit A